MIVCPICRIEYQDDGALRFCRRCGSDMIARPSPEGAEDWIGRVIDGRYKVLARIGVGGMGVVYRVEHVRMGKIAAMKALHRELAGDDQAVKRFRREVEAVSRLNHPNIVQTFDFGYFEGLLYVIMELVKGDDLGTIVKREGPMPLARALPLFAQVCSALDEAHALGVVHRDLKPENIVCVRRRTEEHAKVLDFGLAKLRERTELGEITVRGNIIGTPYYMAPEQVRSEAVDARSDVYGLGATLYRVVTGKYPFEAESPIAAVGKHLTEELVPPSLRVPELALPPELDRVVLRAMAREPAQRLASAVALRQALEELNARLAERRATEERARAAGTGARRADEILPLADLDEPADGSEEGVVRLRREDLDAFERQRVKRRRFASYLVMPTLLVGLAASAWAIYRLLDPRPTRTEVEPNDTPARANLLPRDAPVYGRIGPPPTPEEPDMDYFRIPRGAGRRAVLARITGIPDVDLVLELYDDQGGRLGKVDGGRAGDGEILGPWAIGGDEVYLRARPVSAPGERPAPGSETPYSLRVDFAPPRSDWELEPNDTPAEALALEDGASVNGYLAAPEDEDWFVVKAPPGALVEGEVEGPDDINLVVLIGGSRRPSDGAEAGEDERFSTRIEQEGALVFGIAEQPAAHGPDRPARPEREEPYTVTVRLRRP